MKRSLIVGIFSSPVIVVLAIGGLRPAFGQEQGKRLSLSEIHWPSGAHGGAGTSHAAGIETVVLDGDPTKPGLYTIRLRVPPNTKIQAHSHRDNRAAVVLSGTWFIGYGQAFDADRLKKLGPGGFYTEPGGVDHFALTKDEPVVVEITGFGPTSTKYQDERLNPTHK